jgi:hypothetical protein
MFEIALINKTFVYRKSLKDLFRKKLGFGDFQASAKTKF